MCDLYDTTDQEEERRRHSTSRNLLQEVESVEDGGVGGMSGLLACCVAVAQTGRRTLCTCRSQVSAFKTLVKCVGQRCKYPNRPNPNFLALRTSLEISFSVMNPCFSFTTLFQQFHSFKKEKTNVYNINSFAIFLKAWRSVRQTNIHRWTGTWDGQRK